jgi:hippurate hydrolase
MSIVLNSYMQSDVVEWRRHLHQHPELLYDVHKTASFLAEKLVAFGCDTVDTGIGQSGVVGIIKGRLGAGPVIGLRSDMDALPILENSGKPWTSKVSGRAHSCGHDGHMAMLLGAARYLAKTRNFRGTVAIIFQPAEEGGGGALAMITDGLMDRFKIEHIFGMHNEPHIPIGQFAIRKGAMLASADTFEITVNGRGGHAGQPHLSVDPVIAAAHIVIGLQSIVSRETDPLQAVVITVASIHGGDTHNVIPNVVTLSGTVRTLRSDLRDFAERRVRELASSVAAAHGARVEISHNRGYPVTFNHDVQTDLAAAVAQSIVGSQGVDSDVHPRMAAEDFSFMLEARPGSMIIIGNGETPGLHNPAYDFNDDAIPFGIGYWVTLIETALAA